MNGVLTTEIILLILFFIGAREFWFKIDLNIIKHHVYSVFYFSFWSLVLILTFGSNLLDIVDDFNIIPISALVFVFCISALIYYFLKNKLTPPEGLMKKYPKEQFLSLSYRYLFAKSFDILFQQIAIITAIVMLNNSGLDIFHITLYFSLIFGFLHSRIIQKEGNIGWVYVIASTLAGLLFPYLILEIDYGFIYTYILHWSYYLLLGVYFWMKGQRRIET